MLLALRPIRERTAAPDPPSVLTAERHSVIEAVAAALCQSHYAGLRPLSVTVHDGVVVLEGAVTSFHLKQLAQQAVLRVLGRVLIRNDLAVTK